MWLRISACAILLVALGVLPSQAKLKLVRVPTGVMLGRYEHKVMPVYPAEAMMKGIQGEVWFNIEVDETGKIVSAQAIKGDPLLIAASKEALEKSRFYPYVVITPVQVEAQLGFHFTVEKNGSGVSGRVECITQGRE